MGFSLFRRAASRDAAPFRAPPPLTVSLEPRHGVAESRHRARWRSSLVTFRWRVNHGRICIPQREPKHGSAGYARHRDRAAVQIENALGDRETESRVPVFESAILLDAVIMTFIG